MMVGKWIPYNFQQKKLLINCSLNWSLFKNALIKIKDEKKLIRRKDFIIIKGIMKKRCQQDEIVCL